MENTTETKTAKNWRKAWRAFAEQFSVHPEAALVEVVAPVSRTKRQRIETRPFQGFGSPQGKF